LFHGASAWLPVPGLDGTDGWNRFSPSTREVAMSKIDIGIKKQDRIKIAEGLKRLLADSYTLYLQTHNFHWNVTGPKFRELHLMFEEHYNELATAVDGIAERIRTLDVAAPGTYKTFTDLNSVREVEGCPKPRRWSPY
jgi:starvation-inducible DNA-binding protein